LFATLALSDKKYTDPSAVLHAIVDDYGNPIQIGEQKDIGEFNSTFLSRIQEGLHADFLLAKLREENLQRRLEESKIDVAEPAQPASGANEDTEMLNLASDGGPKSDDISMIDTTLPLRKSVSSLLALSPMKS
jgi:hypothetical protein